jgi:hypothetical protein
MGLRPTTTPAASASGIDWSASRSRMAPETVGDDDPISFAYATGRASWRCCRQISVPTPIDCPDLSVSLLTPPDLLERLRSRCALFCLGCYPHRGNSVPASAGHARAPHPCFHRADRDMGAAGGHSPRHDLVRAPRVACNTIHMGVSAPDASHRSAFADCAGAVWDGS